MKAAITLLLWCIIIAILSPDSHWHAYGQMMHQEMTTEDRLQESVFRYQFGKFVGSSSAGKQYCFVGVGRQGKFDPSPALIHRLQSNGSFVQGISHCRQSPGGVFDKKTGRKGLAYFVNAVKLISPTKASVNASFFNSGKSGNDAVYAVYHKAGNWQVAKCDVTDVY